MRYFLPLFCFIITSSSFILGQNSKYGNLLHTNSSPQYTQWKNNYLLTKISYYEKRIVLDIKLVFRRGSNQWTKSVIFMPPDNLNAWCLKDPASSQVFKMLEIRNIKRNDKDLKTRVKSSKDKVYIEMEQHGPRVEIFTCQAHFEALPEDVAMVDLLEGPDSKFAEGHWNFFDIKIKQFGKKPIAELPTPAVSNEAELEIGLVSSKNSIDSSLSTQNKRPSLGSIHDIECNKILELSNIIFQDNAVKFQNLTKAERTLFILSTYLKQSPESSIELFGHTDIFGDHDRNLELSQQRVDKLKQWFINQKISPSRIKTKALGDTDPIFAEGNPQNRRVEVQILCPDKE